jgi:hypothetical protein
MEEKQGFMPTATHSWPELNPAVSGTYMMTVNVAVRVIRGSVVRLLFKGYKMTQPINILGNTTLL